MNAKVIIYSTERCPFCVRAKQLLDMKQIPYEEIRVDLDEDQRAKMEKLTQRRTVPQIFINDRHVGGYDDLRKLHEQGELETWLENK